MQNLVSRICNGINIYFVEIKNIFSFLSETQMQKVSQCLKLVVQYLSQLYSLVHFSMFSKRLM